MVCQRVMFTDHTTAHTERFLLESKKHGVQKLDVLEIVIDHVVKFHSLKWYMSSEKKKNTPERTSVHEDSWHIVS